MTAGLVSIVVPIYGVEEYLDKCVESIVNQTYRTIEILLIDDGSPDKCPELCDQWALKDERIRVIHKTNAGLGYARNTGIEHANGEFIYFVDSDDYIEKTLIEDCLRIAKQENADIVFFGHDRRSREGDLVSSYVPDARQKYSGNEVMEKGAASALKHDSNFSLSACFCFISMQIINQTQWRFVSEREILSEDYYSMLKLLGNASSIVIVDSIYYHYMVNQNSLSQVYRADRYERIRHCAKALMSLIEQMGCVEILSPGIASVYLGFVMGAMKQIVNSDSSLQSKIKNIREIVSDEYLQETIQKNTWNSEGAARRTFYKAIQAKSALMCYGIVKARCMIPPKKESKYKRGGKLCTRKQKILS